MTFWVRLTRSEPPSFTLAGLAKGPSAWTATAWKPPA